MISFDIVDMGSLDNQQLYLVINNWNCLQLSPANYNMSSLDDYCSNYNKEICIKIHSDCVEVIFVILGKYQMPNIMQYLCSSWNVLFIISIFMYTHRVNVLKIRLTFIFL